MTGSIGPPLSVAVITCDRPSLCRSLLDVLLGQLRDGDEVLLVDDGRRPMLPAPSGEATLIRTGGVGAGGARNAAMRQAVNEWIVFVDDDIVVPPDFLAQVRHRLRDDDCDTVTANVCCDESCGRAGALFDERYPLSRGPEVVTYRGGTGSRATPNDVWRVGVGAAMAWRTTVLRKIGGFPESIGQGRRYGGAEDLAAFRAALKSGYTIRYDGTLLVRHLSPASMTDLRGKMRGYALADGALAIHVWLNERDAGMLWHLLRDIARTPLTFLVEIARACSGKTHLPLAPIAAFPWRALRGIVGHTILHASRT